MNPSVFRALLLPLTCAALAGCSTIRDAYRSITPPFVQAYRPDVTQGNVVTKEMAEQVRLGMTRDQVRFMLGTPLLTSDFHRARWDYVYYLKRGKGNETQFRKVTVWFDENRVARIEHDELPPEALADNLILGRNLGIPKKPPNPEPTAEENAPPVGPVFQ
jgi:outer membrane protein assembly factor BamE